MLNLLKTLCEIDGVSGFEDDVRDFIISRISGLASEITVDSIGNIIAVKKGRQRAKRTLMLAAHMDEVGMIVKRITDEGMLGFGFCGGVDRRVVFGKRVRVGDRKIPGVIGVKAVHLTNEEERKNVPKTDDLYIDIGAQTKKAAEELVSLGDYAAFDSEFSLFGEGYIKSKAIDDRIGCAVLINLMEMDLPCDTAFAFTAQEETGLRGATIAANRIEPDHCLVLEGTTAADIAFVDKVKTVCRLSMGPVIPFMDGATIYDREICSRLIRIADEHGIKWQTKQYISGGTDAGIIHRSGSGVKTGALAAPVRYLHSGASVASVSDCENMLRLAKLFMEDMQNA
ncbi:MAG: M42 family metallopeptidase [Bacillota bacterium]|nr:M42 family metallopeptidase [Bacillota bacterium]